MFTAKQTRSTARRTSTPKKSTTAKRASSKPMTGRAAEAAKSRKTRTKTARELGSWATSARVLNQAEVSIGALPISVTRYGQAWKMPHPLKRVSIDPKRYKKGFRV